jgi:glutamate synthase (NADPH/NADH) small chain
MADPRGFLTTPRELPPRRPVHVRVRDWREVYEPGALLPIASKQASRCMDCGIPFCHTGCPLGNLIPEWNDLVRTDRWEEAADRLHATNNFPEFTGRLCPAPCETACVLGIAAEPVTIKNVELAIADRALGAGWAAVHPPPRPTGRAVAVVGSGPAGLAAAQQLARAGHAVTVYERADRIGGLLRYGIPEFKMEKAVLDSRLAQLRAERVTFRTGVDVGADITATELRDSHDAVVLAVGATQWRELPVPGRGLDGVLQAMEYLPPANRVCAGDITESPVSAAGRHVVVIGGGDTGADCVGTAHRQGALSVTQLEIMPRPPESRPAGQPWPTYPMLFRVSSAHEEGGERVYGVGTQEFLADETGRVRGLQLVGVGSDFEPIEGTERELRTDLVLLALGFVGPQRGPLLADLGVSYDQRGSIARHANFSTDVPGVFVAGDAGRGQSLIVWAIAEGRSAAAAVDTYLTGETDLPAPIRPTDRPLSAA